MKMIPIQSSNDLIDANSVDTNTKKSGFKSGLLLGVLIVAAFWIFVAILAVVVLVFH
jgi:hypothetical protein